MFADFASVSNSEDFSSPASMATVDGGGTMTGGGTVACVGAGTAFTGTGGALWRSSAIAAEPAPRATIAAMVATPVKFFMMQPLHLRSAANLPWKKTEYNRFR